MKNLLKVILIFTFILLAIGCNKKESWPNDIIIEYSKGTIDDIIKNDNGYDIKIFDTSKSDYYNYIDALKTISFYYYDAYGFNENENLNEAEFIWTATNNKNFIEIKYIVSTSSVNIEIYNNKPTNWK